MHRYLAQVLWWRTAANTTACPRKGSMHRTHSFYQTGCSVLVEFLRFHEDSSTLPTGNALWWSWITLYKGINEFQINPWLIVDDVLRMSIACPDPSNIQVQGFKLIPLLPYGTIQVQPQLALPHLPPTQVGNTLHLGTTLHIIWHIDLD